MVSDVSLMRLFKVENQFLHLRTIDILCINFETSWIYIYNIYFEIYDIYETKLSLKMNMFHRAAPPCNYKVTKVNLSYQSFYNNRNPIWLLFCF